MRRWKQFLAASLAVLVATCSQPLYTFLNNTGNTGVVWTVYADDDDGSGEEIKFTADELASATICDNADDLTSQVKEHAENRETEITVYYRVDSSKVTDDVNTSLTDALEGVLGEVIGSSDDDSIIGDGKLFEYDASDPKGGDYLFENISGLEYVFTACQAKLSGDDTAQYYAKIVFKVEYHSSQSLESAVTDGINSAITKAYEKANISSDTASVYDKAEAIYNWVCTNVKYDKSDATYDGYTKYSTYAAVVKKSAVCQGYATLLCRMMLQEGIECRIITGTSLGSSPSAGGAHAWNIVKLGETWYLCDPTWDGNLYEDKYDGQAIADNFKTRWFLKGTGDFDNPGSADNITPDGTHDTYDDYPYKSYKDEGVISADVFDKDKDHYYVDGKCTICNEECTHEYENGKCTICKIECTHNYVEDKDNAGNVAATCSKEGVKVSKCSVCGMTKMDATAKTEHTWNTEYTVDKAATATEKGSESIHCSVCDEKQENSSRDIPATGNNTDTDKSTDGTENDTATGDKNNGTADDTATGDKNNGTADDTATDDKNNGTADDTATGDKNNGTANDNNTENTDDNTGNTGDNTGNTNGGTKYTAMTSTATTDVAAKTEISAGAVVKDSDGNEVSLSDVKMNAEIISPSKHSEINTLLSKSGVALGIGAAYYDVSLVNASGNKLTLSNGKARITFAYPSGISSSYYKFSVYHIKDGTTVEKLNVETTADGIVVETTGFSPFVISYTKDETSVITGSNGTSNTVQTGSGNTSQSGNTTQTGNTTNTTQTGSSGNTSSASQNNNATVAAGNTTTAANAAATTAASTGTAKSVKTGDMSNILPYVVLICLAVMLVFGADAARNRRRFTKKNK